MTIYLCAIDLPYLWEKIAIKKDAIQNGTYNKSHEPNKTQTYLNILFFLKFSKKNWGSVAM